MATSAILATRRWYRADTLVLETEFDTATGTVRMTDCMPVREGHPHLVRAVEGVSGTVDMHMDLVVRFDYGEVVPWVTSHEGLTAPDRGSRLGRAVAPGGGRGQGHAARWRTSPSPRDERYPFTLVWYPSHEEPPPPLDSYYAVHLTEAYWSEWATQCCYEGPYHDAVVRSLITLKALTYEPTGGIVAAATTSLPEALGGNRNWDYRYCWLRDATLTLESLMRGGYFNEAMAWRDWLLRAVAGDVSKLQIMYGPGGERRLDEWEADWLPGYEGSAPVRIGNAASEQYQLDVYGEVHVGPVFVGPHRGRAQPGRPGQLQVQLIKFIETGWLQPDDGIWEVRGPRRHFTHSKVMAWVAVDRAVRTLEEWPDLEGSARAVADAAPRHPHGGLREGLQPGRRRLHPVLRLGPARRQRPHDPPRRVPPAERPPGGEHRRGGAERPHGPRVRAALPTADDGAVDGLTGREGAFLACSFWLVDCLHMIGRQEEATELFERLLALRNDLGLLSEEYDPLAGGWWATSPRPSRTCR